jgi:hypothetical protein
MSGAGNNCGGANLAAIAAIDAVRDIRVSIGVLGVIEAQGRLTRDELRAAIDSIEDQLATIEAALPHVDTGVPVINMPLMTLGEVAARARYRAGPQLTLVEGGAA